jgi:phosphatidate cytidylyltransferase
MTSPNGLGASSARSHSELMQRIGSAAVLVAITIGAAWAGAWPFGILFALVAGVASWEWGRVVRGEAFDGLLLLHTGAVVAAVLLAVAGYGVPAAIGLLVVAIVMLILRWRQRDVLTGAGVLATGLPGVSLAWLRTDDAHGLVAVLFVFLVVWATDVGGYVFGRALGGPKLWVRVSPNKTWAGAIGGLFLAGVAGLATGWFSTSPDLMGTGLIAVLLGIAAVLGDLAESALKRRFGRKDASNLIPGHGGVLDRVDGLMAAAVLAAVFVMLRNPMHPGSGLLFLP